MQQPQRGTALEDRYEQHASRLRYSVTARRGTSPSASPSPRGGGAASSSSDENAPSFVVHGASSAWDSILSAFSASAVDGTGDPVVRAAARKSAAILAGEGLAGQLVDSGSPSHGSAGSGGSAGSSRALPTHEARRTATGKVVYVPVLRPISTASVHRPPGRPTVPPQVTQLVRAECPGLRVPTPLANVRRGPPSFVPLGAVRSSRSAGAASVRRLPQGPTSLEQWSVEQVEAWARERGLGEAVAQILAQEQVSGKVLLSMREADVEHVLGLAIPDARRRVEFLAAVEAVR